MALNTFSAGVNTSFSTELNENFAGISISEIYTGTGFNSISTGTTSAEYELTAISSADIDSADYLVIESTVEATAKTGTTNPANASARIRIQTKEIGGAYSDSLALTDLLRADSTGNSYQTKTTRTIIWYHTLTAGEKSNGVQVKLYSESGVTGASSTSSVTNIQTILKRGV